MFSEQPRATMASDKAMDFTPLIGSSLLRIGGLKVHPQHLMPKRMSPPIIPN